MEWGRSSRVWCTSMSFVGLNGVCVVGRDPLREVLRVVDQRIARARTTARGYAIDLGPCGGYR